MTTKLRTATLQVRAKEGEEGVIEAYASVFDVRYDIGLGLFERVTEGAFADSLAERPVLAIYHEHGWRRGDAPIGVTREAKEDETGLYIEAELFVDDDPKARSVYRSVERGALKEWSIGFEVREEVKVTDDDGLDVLEVRKANVLEASTTIKGANPETETVGVRSLERCPYCDGRTAEAPADEGAASRDDVDDVEARDEDETGDEGAESPTLAEVLDLTDPAHRALLDAVEGEDV